MFQTARDQQPCRRRLTVFVSGHSLVRLFVLIDFICRAGVATAQEGVRTTTLSDALRVHLVCATCDPEVLAASIAFVEFGTDPDDADVHVVAVDSHDTGQPYRLTFLGKGRFSGRDRVLSLSPSPASASEARRELVRLLKLGLVEYAADTVVGSGLDVNVRRMPTPPPTVLVNIDGPALDVTVRQLPPPAKPPVTGDKWNHWVFHVNLEADGAGEQSTFEHSHHVSAGANRTTRNWKLRVGASRSLTRSSFTVSDDTTVTSRVSDWSVDSVAVRSAGGHLAFAFAGTMASSTFSNERRVVRAASGIEYDVFPYAQSTRRSLTIQYLVGLARYEYATETLFGNLSEDTTQHALETSLGLRQPWGHVGSTLVFRQQLSALDRSRVTFQGNLSVRLTNHVSLTSTGSYARIRDQFTLPRGEATDEEVLLRQRQLATGHRYAMTVGLTLSFGALANATVNPRFTR